MACGCTPKLEIIVVLFFSWIIRILRRGICFNKKNEPRKWKNWRSISDEVFAIHYGSIAGRAFKSWDVTCMQMNWNLGISNMTFYSKGVLGCLRVNKWACANSGSDRTLAQWYERLPVSAPRTALDSILLVEWKPRVSDFALHGWSLSWSSAHDLWNLSDCHTRRPCGCMPIRCHLFI